MNQAAVNIHVFTNVCYKHPCNFYVDISFLKPLCSYQGVWLLDHMERVLFNFVWNCHCLAKRLYHFAFLTATDESSYGSTSSPPFDVVSVFYFGRSNRCVVVAYFLKICISMMPSNVSILTMLICYLYIFVVRYLLRSSHIF